MSRQRRSYASQKKSDSKPRVRKPVIAPLPSIDGEEVEVLSRHKRMVLIERPFDSDHKGWKRAGKRRAGKQWGRHKPLRGRMSISPKRSGAHQRFLEERERAVVMFEDDNKR